MVYLSNATEVGTVYTKDELSAIRNICDERGLLLLLDGARIGPALTSCANDLTLAEICDLTDIFWIGGTKNGALLGEAIVVKDAALASDFEFHIKQQGCLLAKGRTLGVQFARLFHDNLYFDIAAKANRAAQTLSTGIANAGYEIAAPTETNQVFAVLPKHLIARLHRDFGFHVWENVGEQYAMVRLLTSWCTHELQVDKFISIVTAHSEANAP